MLDAIEAGGAEIVTVSIRRISLEGYAESLVDLLGGRYHLLPNTAGCATVKDAVLTAQLAREALGTDWVKLELIGDRETLYPDVEQLVQAAEELVNEGFIVLPYCNEIRSPAASSPMSAAPRSCRSARRSAPASASATRTTSS